MHRIYYKRRHDDSQEHIIHDLDSQSVVLSYEITQSLESVSTFEFDMGLDNPFYNDIDPINGLIRVINVLDGTVEFEGRVLQPTSRMTAQNGFVKTFICEGYLAYLNDSTQTYMKFTNNGIKNYIQNILAKHNAQVEPHKQMHAGNVTVEDTDNYPHNYIGYDNSFDTIKTFLKDRFGGVFVLRKERNILYLDYVNREDLGKKSQVSLELGKNVKSARRTVNFDEMITRLVPLGDAVEKEGTSEEVPDGQQTTQERTTIASVNGGKIYLEDTALIRKFGIIQRPREFEYTKTPAELLKKAQDFMARQAITLTSWEIEVTDLSLIDSGYDKLKVGNFHPVVILPLSGVEQLQIVEKVISSKSPQSPKLVVGDINQTFTAYQAQPFNRIGG